MKHGVLSGKNTILLSTLRRSFPWAWALFLACCGLLSAWGGVAASHAAEAGYAAATPPPVTPPATATPEPFMPVIEEFRCEPCAIDPGETATLRWTVRGARWVTLDGRGVEAPGTLRVRPDQTTTYRLVAANPNGRSEKAVTIEVRGLPVIHHFTCSPCQVRAGEPATLSWDLSGGVAAYLDGQGVVAPGSTVVYPQKTTTYRLEAVGERGSVERLVTVTVLEGVQPDVIRHTLEQLGYRVRAVHLHPLASGGRSWTVVMTAACPEAQACAHAIAAQFYWGLKVLYDSGVSEPLTVGLFDGVRYTTFLTVTPATLEAFLRGAIDGQTLWRSGRWNVWDDWHGRWLNLGHSAFTAKLFTTPRFVH
ncbi:MAG: hypothetical protein RMK79_04865 [Anaerolineae bacterium]|nr:hypothetical protein [Anaerolineae bacterium]